MVYMPIHNYYACLSKATYVQLKVCNYVFDPNDHGFCNSVILSVNEAFFCHSIAACVAHAQV